MLIVVTAVVAVTAVAGALVLTDTFSSSGGRPHDVAHTTPATPRGIEPATTASPIPESDGSTAIAPAPQPDAPRSVRASVSRTCGRGGVGGDCHLSVRAQPASDAAELQRLDEGDPLRLSCQMRGERVHSSALGASSTVWSRTTHGGYVSNVYVTGLRLKARTITLRQC
jgi:hypothetical protein